MDIRRLRIRSFRNIQNTELQFVPALNIFLGNNGQGKTNILEAVYYLSTTKSHRNADDDQLIRYGDDFATLDASVNYRSGPVAYSAVIHRKGKTLCVSRDPVKKVSEFVGRINAVIFSPLDMNLFESSPGARRRLIDIELGKMSRIYITALNRYGQLLKNRNACLKQGSSDSDLIAAISEQMIAPEIEVIKQRQRLISRINSSLSAKYAELSGTAEPVRIDYLSAVPWSADETAMAAALREKQTAAYEHDLASKATNTGIHREDLVFYLSGHSAAANASQGQKRMILIALRLVLADIIYEHTDEYPILLLDDVLSELDDGRKNALIRLLPPAVQTIITATDRNSIDDALLSRAKIYVIEKGSASTWMK